MKYILFSIDPVENGQYFYGTFSASAKTLSSTIVNDGYAGMSSGILNTIRLLGATSVTEITVNGVAHTDFDVLPSGEVQINNLNLPVASAFTITY